MGSNSEPRYVFEEQLKLESERVLADPIFQRAPVQSQLLAYLVERAMAGPKSPTQYEIAVDGLGKLEDYDVENDSYPRVQISRLRRNLEAYYARNLPGNGLRLQIAPGSYRLSLLKATEEEPDVLEVQNGLASLRADLFAAQRRDRSRTLRKFSFLTIGAMTAIGIAGLIVSDWRQIFIFEPAKATKPETALIFDSNPSIFGTEFDPKLAETLRGISEIQLTNSFVSRPLPASSAPENADYVVDLSFGLQGGAPVLFLALINEDGDVLYTESVDLDPEVSSDFAEELEGAFVYITSPTGVIAKNELKTTNEALASDYMCFLNIENGQSRSGVNSSLVDQCIEKFPGSEYQAFWLSRRAFSWYQARAAASEPIGRSGEGWDDLRSALQIDQYNPFANFVAAKVELAEGYCGAADRYIERSLERGASYPVLVAAAEVNVAACLSTPERPADLSKRLGSLARLNPDPDPLLYVYLIIGLISAGDLEEARSLSRRVVIEAPSTPVEETSQVLKLALETGKGEMTPEQREKLSQAIGAFIWQREAVDRIVDAIGS